MKPKHDSWEAFRRLGDQRINEAIERIKGDEAVGVYRSSPRTEALVHTMQDLCCYVSRKVGIDGSYQVRLDGERVRTWVWSGPDYTNTIVSLVERIVSRLPERSELEELRLAGTRVDAEGAARLQRAFPQAKVTIFSADHVTKNWRWSQAHYNGQPGSDWEREAAEQNSRWKMNIRR